MDNDSTAQNSKNQESSGTVPQAMQVPIRMVGLTRIVMRTTSSRPSKNSEGGMAGKSASNECSEVTAQCQDHVTKAREFKRGAPV